MYAICRQGLAGRRWITHYRSGCLEAIHLAAWPHCRNNIYVSLVPLWQLKLRTVWSSMESAERQTKRLKIRCCSKVSPPYNIALQIWEEETSGGARIKCGVQGRSKSGVTDLTWLLECQKWFRRPSLHRRFPWLEDFPSEREACLPYGPEACSSRRAACQLCEGGLQHRVGILSHWIRCRLQESHN